eukprot:scaffold1272_cov250-Pinguiococcus_pyrenoidosus.AAC.35
MRAEARELNVRSSSSSTRRAGRIFRRWPELIVMMLPPFGVRRQWNRQRRLVHAAGDLFLLRSAVGCKEMGAQARTTTS